MKGVYQHDDNDCGLACVLTVCKYFHIKVDESSLRKKLYLGKDGLSLYGVSEVLRGKGINSYALECSVDELLQLYSVDKKPIIIMICQDDEFHYVVLLKCNSEKLYIWDPNRGRMKITRDVFETIWTGYAVKIKEVFYDKQDLTNKSFVLKRILEKQTKLMIIVLLFAILLMGVSIIVTFAYREVVDGIKYGGHEVKNISSLLVVMGTSYILMTAFQIIKEKLIVYANREMEISLNYHFIDSLLNMPIHKREDYLSGGILDRYYRLPFIVKTFSSLFSSVILEILSLLAGIYIMIGIDPNMFAIVNIIVIAYVICFFIAKSKLFILSKSVIDKQAVITTHIKEMVQNLISLKAFDSTRYKNKIKTEIFNLKVNESRVENMSNTISVVLQSIENITMLFILAYGISAINRGNMSLGTLLAFETFVGFYLSPVKNLLGILPSVQEILLTFNKIEDVLLFLDGNKHNNLNSKVSGEMILDKVDIAYGFDYPILSNVSIKINNQDKVFLMGASGSGKSTLAKTMAGLVNCTKGSVLYGGAHINTSKHALYLSQEAEIFSGTIRENILMWQDCKDIAFFEDVLHNIGIYKIMEQRGFTLESHLQENGLNLSGGEKQRIAIARALMWDMPIYIFDEATCHLDMDSEKKIIKYIKQRLCDKTCIFISHNAELLEENDLIIFIDRNKKIHFKKHNHLLKNWEYKKMLNVG